MSRLRIVAVAFGAFGLLLTGLSAGLGPYVRAKAAEKGALRDLSVRIEGVSAIWAGLRLRGVEVASEGSGVFRGHFDEVRLAVDWRGEVQAIAVNGGRVLLRGSGGEVTRWFGDVRGKAKEGLPRAGGTERKVALREIGIDWVGEPGKGEVQIEGVEADHGFDGEAHFGARKVRIVKGPLSVGADSVSMRFGGGPGRARIHRIDARRVDVEVSLADGVTSLGRGANDVSEPGPADRPGDAHELETLRERVGELARLAAERLAIDGEIGSSGLYARVHHNGQMIHIGPARARLAREGDVVVAEVVAGGGETKTPLSLRAEVPTATGPIGLELQGGPVTLSALGAHDGDFGIVGANRATLYAKGKVELSEDTRRVAFDAEGRLSSFGLMDRRLADDAIEGLELGWRAEGEAKTDRSALLVRDGELSLGAMRFRFEGTLDRGAEATRGHMVFSVPVAPCQEMLTSLPTALVPATAGLEVQGVFGVRGRLGFDTQKLEALELDWDVSDACRVVSAPPEIAVQRFRRPFRRMVYDGEGRKTEVLSGPGTTSWVPIEEISPFVAAAVMTTEDGRFYRHKGFDKEAIKGSVQDNLRAGRFVRGASTISMQLAKNLYLDRGKTLSRKLQEVILTAYLEQELSKDEIMELYLNIVELGPMVYGIGPAAEHYFTTSAGELSLGQALYLVSTLPNPKRQYFASDGRVSDRWSAYLQKLMRIMHTRHRITERELMEGMAEIVTYRVPQSPRREGFLEPTDDGEADGYPVIDEGNAP